jgi:hypothetical protein
VHGSTLSDSGPGCQCSRSDGPAGAECPPEWQDRARRAQYRSSRVWVELWV